MVIVLWIFSSLSIAALAICVYFLAMHKCRASFVAIQLFICLLKERVYFSSLSIAALAICVYFLAMHKVCASFVAIQLFICLLKERVYT